MSESLLKALRARRTLPRPAVSALILLNLIWLVLLLTGTDAGPAAWTCGAALALAFLAVPWVSDLGEDPDTPSRSAHLWVAGVTVMAVGLVLTDGENATVMLSYPAIVSVWICRPARARAVWSFLLALLGIGLWYVEGADPGTAAALFGAAVAVAMNHILRAAVARAREARIAQRELVSASRGIERHRLLREVHDIVGQELTLIAMEADRAQAPAADGTAGEDGGIRSVGIRARTLLSRMESELLSLRGTSLAEECRRAEEACAAAGLSITVRCDVPGERLAPQADQVLGCVLREAMTNVFRHAPGARTFRFFVGEDPRGIVFTAVDDGGATLPPRPGMGLTGLRDRLAEIGGELDIDVTADGHFALTGYVPRTVPAGTPKEAP
ncbi:sensor histidine kinase [Streptomyces sp. NPDC091027]|uniref:sensor histidine kinase n=1 Tax=Streptomyces sp. NPDC091027 TaxID=3365971 RepID=UPI0037FC146D